MTSAVFGRMEMGQCVKEDFGFLGCQNDALDVMDAECSGRRECHIIVTINKFRKEIPGACNKAVAGYISAVFTCMKGMKSLY